MNKLSQLSAFSTYCYSVTTSNITPVTHFDTNSVSEYQESCYFVPTWYLERESSLLNMILFFEWYLFSLCNDIVNIKRALIIKCRMNGKRSIKLPIGSTIKRSGKDLIFLQMASDRINASNWLDLWREITMEAWQFYSDGQESCVNKKGT